MSMPWILSLNALSDVGTLLLKFYACASVSNALHCCNSYYLHGWPCLQSGQGNVVLKFAHRTLEAFTSHIL